MAMKKCLIMGAERVLRRAAQYPSPFKSHSMVNQRRANLLLQLVIQCSAHQPCLSNKERSSKQNHFHSHVFFFVGFLSLFLTCFLLGLFSPETWERPRCVHRKRSRRTRMMQTRARATGLTAMKSAIERTVKPSMAVPSPKTKASILQLPLRVWASATQHQIPDPASSVLSRQLFIARRRLRLQPVDQLWIKPFIFGRDPHQRQHQTS